MFRGGSVLCGVVLACAALAACAPMVQEAPAPGLPDVYACGAPKLAGLIGQPVSALPAEGPWATLRILRPGDPMTEDYSPSRLTVELDDQDVILTLTCG